MSTDDLGLEVVTPRSNVVTITDESNRITSILFIPGSLHVSESQPSDPAPKILRDGNVFTISLEAGRHNTQPIAQTFNTLSGGKNNEYAPFKEVDDSPSDLNFMFGVELQFVFQGGTGSRECLPGPGTCAWSQQLVDWQSEHLEFRRAEAGLHDGYP